MNILKFFTRNNIKERQEISPEEILLDSFHEKLKSVQRLELPIPARNFFIFFVIALIAIMGIWLRLFKIQIIEGEYYQKEAERNRFLSKPIYSSRGIIYDKNGKQLVFNLPKFSLMARPIDMLSDFEKLKNNIDLIAETLNNRDEAADLLKKAVSFQRYDSNFRVLIESLNLEEAGSLLGIVENMNGIWVESNVWRQYTDPELAAHLLGYVGRINSNELKNFPNYFLNDFIGKNGLEKQYEDLLRGNVGKEIKEVNFRGEVLRDFKSENPVSGNNLILSIDWDLQAIIDQAMKDNMRRVKSDKGAVIAVEPQTGKILALLSYPSYNSNDLSGGIDQASFENLTQNNNQPLFNRVVSGLYPPGSTIKPIIGSAALAEKIISPLKKIFITGSITISNRYNPSQGYIFKDWKAHGWVDFKTAIAVSSNVYFYILGGGYEDIKGLGIDRIKEYAYRFGLGAKLGIDIPEEKAGIIPDPLWKQSVKKEGWFIGDTYHTSIGQGDILVTPLQLAMATAVIANNGVLYLPQIVEKVLSANGEILQENIPVILNNNVVNRDILVWVREGMRQAITDGSAKKLNSLPISIAGKTGTAQVAGQSQPNAWFTSFAPFQDPSIVLTVLIENGGEGSSAAVPVAEKVYQWYWENRMLDL